LDLFLPSGMTIFMFIRIDLFKIKRLFNLSKENKVVGQPEWSA